jgi:hypothetical protein
MSEELNKEIIRRYNEMNKKQHIRISEKYAKRSISLKLILIDLDTILNCLELINQRKNLEEIILNSLWNNIIITYGKIFTKSRNGFTSLVKKQCVKNEYDQVHNDLINLRNQFVAHREDNEIENALLLVGENRSNGNVGFEYHLPVIMKTSAPIKDLQLLEELINDLKSYVNECLHENLKKIDYKLWAEIKKIKDKRTN